MGAQRLGRDRKSELGPAVHTDTHEQSLPDLSQKSGAMG